jgi:hypothetical protein
MEEDFGERVNPVETDSTAPALENERRVRPTPEEQSEIEVLAYYLVKRRGGWLPPYEHAQAVEDFCLATEMVFRQRLSG